MEKLISVLGYLVAKTGGQINLAEVVEFCTVYEVDLASVTVANLVGGPSETAPSAPAPKRRGRKPGRKPKAEKAAKEKTAKGGKKKTPPRVNGKDHEAAAPKRAKKEALDPKAVLAAIKELADEEGWVKAESIKTKLGVDPASVRNVLNALIEEDKVKYTGKARGTQYALA